MSIPLVGSPPPPINYGDMLTGNSSSFMGSNGNWINSGGTLTHDSTNAYMWPSNNTGSLKFVTDTAGNLVEVAVPGTFKAGVTYSVMLLVTVEENLTCDLDFNFGLIPTDYRTYSLPSDTPESHTNGRFLAVVVRWIPTATRTGVKVRVVRAESSGSGTRTIHVAHAKVFREDPKNTLPILASPENSTTGPQQGVALTVTPGTQDTRLGVGGKNSGGVTFDYGGGVSLGNNSSGTVAVPYVGLGVSDYVGIWMQSEKPETPGDLVSEGCNIEVGTDYVGMFISEKDADTVQLFADTTAGYMMQLRHRGIDKGWAVSDDGSVNARIESSFQWPLYVPGTLTTGTNVAAYFETPNKCRIDEVRAHVGTAPTGASLILDVNDDGTTIFTTQANRPHVGVNIKNLISGGSSSDSTTYTTGSVTLRKGVLYILSIENSHDTAASAVDSIYTLTNGYLTMTSRSTTTFNGGLNRVSIWTGIATGNYTGDIGITFSGGNQTGCAWSLDEVTGVDTTTNDGVVQQAVGTGSDTTPLATLAAFASATNGAYAAHGHAAADATAPGTGWTELSDVTAATPAQALQTSYRMDNDTTADATITSAAWGSCAVELSASNSATSRSADGGTAIAKDSVISIDIDQIGATIPGADLVVFVRGRYIW